MPPKQKPNEYSLRRRFFHETGYPLDWQDSGKAAFKDLETVQAQIKLLANRGRKVEIEYLHGGKLCGYNGEETGKTIIYETR